MLLVCIYLHAEILLFTYSSGPLRIHSKQSPAHAGHDSSKNCECKYFFTELQQTEKKYYHEYFTERKLRKGEMKCLGQGL